MRCFALAILLTVLTILPAAADPIDDAIKARRAFYTLLNANIGPLAAMAKGEVDYQAELAQLYADNLGQMAGYKKVPHFRQGSSKDDRPGKTRALAKIWSEVRSFQKKVDDFKAAALNVKAEAGKGRAALGSAVGKLGSTCKACHDEYRAKDF